MMSNVLKIKTAVSALMLWAMLLVVAACSVDDGLPDDRAIGFAAERAGTRALPTQEVRKIGVFGYSHQGNFSGVHPATLFPGYFLNKAVIDKAGNGVWSYDGVVKYWPTDDDIRLSFFAYAPYIDVENTFALRPAAISETGLPAITYTVPAAIDRQIDLLWSRALNQTYGTGNGKVTFTMYHALTKVGFDVKLAEAEEGRPYLVTIRELTLQNLIGGGVLDLSAGQWAFDYPADDAGLTTYTYTPATGLADLTLDATDPASTASFVSLFGGGHSLMLTPQVLKDQHIGLTPPEVRIRYTCVNTYSGETVEDEATLQLATATLEQWQPGEGVNYQITVSLLEGTEITFDIDGILSHTPWQDGNNGTPVVGNVN